MTLSAPIVRRISIGVSAAALAIGAALPAQAATTPGWRVSASVHYGAANTYSAFWDVAPVTSKVAWAVGGLNDAVTGIPAAYHWTGRSWAASSMPKGLQGSLNAISAPSANDLWAVSDLGGYILHYNGSKWSAATKRFTGFGELTGVTAFSPSNVWVFGGPGAYPGFGTWRYNGTAWKQDTAASDLGIVEASPVSATNMWAVGSGTAPEDTVLHYTGTWQQAKASALSGLQFTDIKALSGTNVWAAADAQTSGFKSYLVHTTRHSWARIAVPWAVSVGHLTTDGHGGFWLTAEGSTYTAWVLHWSSTGHWSRTELSTDGGVFGIAQLPGTTSLWATGTVNTKTGANATIWADGRV